ncbi:putative Na(+)/H(+) antiporter GerT [Gracilariopsis chorda]|uniref:Putative Na(+)/H(+) antiporter GerT n=1 Tax=Gracilariopsis chorda TaxID=448386 RepID=A0A2V3IW07_9FLOR|nr:putative Na(+)/H(+) antiporter GerT [Gracilariopsis chorda]|eukprot:PXF46328.1 putative Na(+)/H(+) antiporter GerT [Gracilariopsis chorda]
MSTDLDLVRLGVFLSCCYVGREVSRLVRVSPVVTYIAVGGLLGPPLADFAPSPTGIQLAGLLGILLSVVDAGLRTQREELKKSLVRALVVAVLGVIFPISGVLLIHCVSDALEGNFETSRTLKTAFAIGSAIAPTSLGVTARLLKEVGELETSLGQLISVAAVIDDVISLILLSQVIAMASPDPSIWDLVQPFLFSVVFITGVTFVALLLPMAIPGLWQKAKIPECLYPRLGIWFLLLSTLLLAYLATLSKTSFLLAGYLTGIAFSEVPSSIAVDPWERNITAFVDSLCVLFFAGTIGFVIPLRTLFSGSAITLGALFSISSVFGKMLCGLGMLPNYVDGVAVAVAMLGRGEFGFLIASQAQASGLLSQKLYAATTWGILVPTLLTPLLFGSVFGWRKGKLENSQVNTEL